MSNLTGFETRLLSELQLVVAERAAALEPTRQISPTRQAWPRRRLALTGALSATLAAALAVTITLTTSGGAQPPGGNFATATTAAAVLDNAALAALHEPTLTPHPGQFVYTKTYVSMHDARHHGDPAVRGTQSIESWGSVGGTRQGSTVTSVNYGAGGTKQAAVGGALVRGRLCPSTRHHQRARQATLHPPAICRLPAMASHHGGRDARLPGGEARSAAYRSWP